MTNTADIEVELGRRLSRLGLTLSTAESCTGGGIAALVTSVPGSSAYFRGGVVAYSNEVKTSVLGVSPLTIETYDVVSREVVTEMARGVQALLHTDCAISTSGIAGPDGGTAERPVGTIWIAVARGDRLLTRQLSGDGGRQANTERAIRSALRLLLDLL